MLCEPATDSGSGAGEKGMPEGGGCLEERDSLHSMGHGGLQSSSSSFLAEEELAGSSCSSSDRSFVPEEGSEEEGEDGMEADGEESTGVEVNLREFPCFHATHVLGLLAGTGLQAFVSLQTPSRRAREATVQPAAAFIACCASVSHGIVLSALYMHVSMLVLPDQEGAIAVGQRMVEFFTRGARAGGSEGSSSMEASDEDDDDDAPIWRYHLCARPGGILARNCDLLCWVHLPAGREHRAFCAHVQVCPTQPVLSGPVMIPVS
jgi:hypothetical protein